jgi:hypothetical protein
LTFPHFAIDELSEEDSVSTQWRSVESENHCG